MLTRQSTHEGALPNGGKTNKAHTGNTSPRHIETSWTRSILHRDLPEKSVYLQPPPPPLEVGVRSSRFNLASFAFN